MAPSTPRVWNDFLTSTGYGHRPSQDELVTLITKTLEKRGHLLARAGTGTGKSLASVIPSLSYALSRASALHGGPVIVSTATKALQGQYYLKDLPFMAKHFAKPDSKDKAKGFNYAVLKGKRNYLCRDRLAAPTMPIPVEIMKHLSGLPKTHEGDLSTIELTTEQRMALSISTDDCPGATDCMFHDFDDFENGCYYERAKKKANDSEVMVVNHALLAAHLKIMIATEGHIALLPNPSVIVLDECHKFTGYVQNAMGWTLSRNRLYRWANECLEGNDVKEFKDLVKEFFDKHIQWDVEDKKSTQQIVPRETMQKNKLLVEMSTHMDEALDFWTDEAADSKSNDDRKKVRRTQNMIADFDVALEPDDEDNFWVELDRRGDKELYYKPAETKVAEFMKLHLWPSAPAILLSATTPTAESMGLPEETEEFEADSPFDYKHQSRLYISQTDGAAPQGYLERQMWEKRRHDEMLALVAASDGRALLLFTSWADLNKAHEVLAPKFKAAGCTVLKQDRDNEGERDRLAKLFKEDETSVLFGTESFFEGIDIPGRSLQLVIISKLPFPAMIDNTRGGKLDFRKDMLPEMRKKLVQATGRLIRDHSDKGLVAVLDSRLATKPYGRNVLANISPFNEMTEARTLKEAMDYLESLEDE